MLSNFMKIVMISYQVPAWTKFQTVTGGMIKSVNIQIATINFLSALTDIYKYVKIIVIEICMYAYRYHVIIVSVLKLLMKKLFGWLINLIDTLVYVSRYYAKMMSHQGETIRNTYNPALTIVSLINENELIIRFCCSSTLNTRF